MSHARDRSLSLSPQLACVHGRLRQCSARHSDCVSRRHDEFANIRRAGIISGDAPRRSLSWSVHYRRSSSADGVEVVLVSAEVWPDEVVVRARGLPSERTVALERLVWPFASAPFRATGVQGGSGRWCRSQAMTAHDFADLFDVRRAIAS